MYQAEQPKYVQLAETLRARIAAGEYHPGDTIPSEPRLAAEHGVSRPTVVRALELLKRDGWIEGRQGYGTVVRQRLAAEEAIGQLTVAVEAVLQAVSDLAPERRAELLASARAAASRLDEGAR